MAETLIDGGNIANVERVKVVTKETTPVTYVIETSSDVSFTGEVSSGAETELRVRNAIHGLIKTEDILKGYAIEFSDKKLNPQILALVDGGTLTGTPGEVGEKYAAPAAGAAVSRTAFDLFVYTSDRDTDGDAIAYHEWKFPHCKGKPWESSFKDGDFATPKYKIYNRPASGESPVSMERIASLPSTIEA